MTNLRSYQIGFVLSVLLTLGAFAVARVAVALGTPVVLDAIVLAAVAQLFVQLFFFLHMGRKDSPRWNLGIFMLTVLIIGILVGGTLWIMYNLEHLHMHSATPASMPNMYQGGVAAPQNELH